MTQTNSQIREEWKETVDRANNFTTYVKMSGSYVLNSEAISDWWLSKLDSLLKTQREEMIEKTRKAFDSFLLKDWSGESEVELEIERLKNKVLESLIKEA